MVKSLLGMTQIIDKKKIVDTLEVIPIGELIHKIEAGFVAYSQGKVNIPPVGHLHFDDPPGDIHVKQGYILGGDCYVVKVASNFYRNPEINLPSSNGLMLIFSKNTGELLGILLDEGYLTDVRTAIAGAIAAKYLAPSKVTCIGIIGTGTQARMQLKYLTKVIDCNHVIVWGRRAEKLQAYVSDMDYLRLTMKTTTSIADVIPICNVIVTTTPATSPLFRADMVMPGTHITAVGADTKGKQELDPHILQKADLVVADSLSQCIDQGEIHYAIEQKLIEKKSIMELGNLIQTKAKRTNDTQITVADLTGVAVQDIQIAKLIFENL